MRKFNKKLVLSIVALVMISTLGIGKALGYLRLIRMQLVDIKWI